MWRSSHVTLSLLVTGMLTASLVDVAAPQAGSTPGPPSATAPATTQDFALDLAGDTWRLKTGDDVAWSRPRFDDSGWETAQVPQEGGQPVFANYDGYAWFRLEFTLPASAQGTPLVAALGGIDDADVTYLNGQRIGSTGTFPPDDDSQWFEQRLYPVPASVPRFGATNVLAVRMNDFTGGGGWYAGPVGLYSKAALRETFYGLEATPASQSERRSVRRVMRRQADAILAGRWATYRGSLAARFFHDGDTRQRRVSYLRSLSRRFGPLRVRDTEVQVLRDRRSGALIADTNRSIVGQDGSGPKVVAEVSQEFLYFSRNPATGAMRERGNRSRYFLDSVRSKLEGRERDFAVYLPPSYVSHPRRRYPTIYLLHGINGGAAEWATRDIQGRIDRLVRRRDLEEAIVVMPDAESLWYVDSSQSPYRSMFIKEMLPLVDRAYRTRDRRGMRGLTGVSMGGHGAFTIGWAHPGLFSSIASHMGALDLPPLAGTPDEVASHSDQTPTIQVAGRSSQFLSRYRYFFDACQDDDFDFDDAVRVMDAELTAKGVEHSSVVYPRGRHNDACWVPHLYASFKLHSDNFRDR